MTPAGFVAWSYDSAGRLLTETTPAGTIQYAYNAAGQRTSLTVADRPSVTYGYDTAGRLESISQALEVFTFSYDTLSQTKKIERPNNVTTDYNYDSDGKLQRLTHTNGLNQALEDYQHTYTADGDLASLTSLFSEQQLPAAKNVTAADGANRITGLGDASYNFDAEGQPITKIDGQGTTTYQWDARGRLTQVSLPGGQAVSYNYDALGRRIQRTTANSNTTFLYDGSDVVLDRNVNGGDTDYLNAPGIDSKLRQTNTNTGALYFLQDHLGSTIALADAAGAVVERQQYQTFGESSGSALTRYGYTGRERDNTTGLLYYRARWSIHNREDSSQRIRAVSKADQISMNTSGIIP